MKQDNKSDSEKICEEFMSTFFTKGCIDDQIKCSDILKKYNEWAKEKKIKKPPSRNKLYDEIKKQNYVHNKSLRFEDKKITTAFQYIKLKD